MTIYRLHAGFTSRSVVRMKMLAVWDGLEEYENTYAYACYSREETRDKIFEVAQTTQALVVDVPKKLGQEFW